MSQFTESAARQHTSLRKDAVGLLGILFFVLSAQAPLTGVVGAAALAVALGNGAGAPGAYVIVGLVLLLFSVGYTTIARRVDCRGGFYAIVRAGLGCDVGSIASWLALISYTTIQAAMYGLYGATTAGLLQAHLGLAVPWWTVAAVTGAIVYGLGVCNIEAGARVLAVLVIGEVAILLAMSAGVLLTGGGPEGLDLAASFSPGAMLVGAPGIAILFAIASMFGFESTAIYAGEAKDPNRTIPRATYTAVVAIALFLAFLMWILITYYGAGAAQQSALDALGSDPASFVLVPMTEILGSWAADVAAVLLSTSLFAGILAFHNVINRYLHAMAGNGELPEGLARTNRFSAPSVAASVQTISVVLVIAPFVLTSMDPLTTLFAWLSGQAVATLVALYLLTSVAIIAYFRRNPGATTWTGLVAPALSVVCMTGELGLIAGNFRVLTGGSLTTCVLLLGSVPVVALVGWLTARVARRPAGMATPELVD